MVQDPKTFLAYITEESFYVKATEMLLGPNSCKTLEQHIQNVGLSLKKPSQQKLFFNFLLKVTYVEI